MSGRHRGRASLRWRLVVAVLAAAVGRGYAGLHRLEVAALGLTPPVGAPLEAAGLAAVPASAPRLSVVPVLTSPDPLVDTMPHPVVKLFPMPVVEPAPSTVSAEDAVFSAVDRERAAQATGDLASVDLRDPAAAAYQGRHSA